MISHMMKKYLFLLIFLLFCVGLEAQKLSGKVVGVNDGDTFEMLVGNRKLKVRLEGIDCPEKGQAFGNAAKTYTSNLVFGQYVSVYVKSYDRYKRAIAIVYLPGGGTLNEALLSSGMAWHFKKYNNDKSWARLENQARKSRIGLWSDSNPIPPWEFRKSRRR
jgi:endonuclease YncB( thermonuclease family)